MPAADAGVLKSIKPVRGVSPLRSSVSPVAAILSAAVPSLAKGNRTVFSTISPPRTSPRTCRRILLSRLYSSTKSSIDEPG